MTKAEKEYLRNNPVNLYYCCHEDCKSIEAFNDFKKLKAHLISVHGQTEPLNGTKQMTSHISGSGFHLFTYKFELESGLSFTKTEKRVKK